jgi:Zn-dependent peptidase ImmA (M78 family)
MHTDLKHLINLFKGVRDVRAKLAEMPLPDGAIVHSMPMIVSAFEDVYKVKIRRFKVPDLKDNLLRGTYLSFGANVHVYIDKNLSPDWERYITIKEMCHLILTDPEYMTENPGDLLEMMIHEETTPKDGEAPLDLVSDMWAKWAAYEILFPHEDRADARTQLDADGEALFALAEKYQIPEHVVDWVLSDVHIDTCKVAWAALSN